MSNSRARVKWCVWILSLMLVFLVAAVKYPRSREINYQNSDATWHVLLTMTAYEETPASTHLFLPLVSLADGKDIPWGHTLPDRYGNYYYTSFSAAGYFAPYLFVKLFHLSTNETSLFLFNTFLLCLSVLLLVSFLEEILPERKGKTGIILFVVWTYVSVPEVMHGMGIVYWHQSLMQVTLLAQIICWYRKDRSAGYRAGFYLLCLLNPYIEWTGFVANIGFVVTELVRGFRRQMGEGWKHSLAVVGLTIGSGMLFCLHFLIILDANAFFQTCKDRFLVRKGDAQNYTLLLLKGYKQSFYFLWVLLFLLFLIVFVACHGKFPAKESILWNHKALFAVSLFPVLENMVMKEHAVEYAFDRMKLAFPLLLLLADLLQLAFLKMDCGRLGLAMLTGMVFFSGAANMHRYCSENDYVWVDGERQATVSIAQQLEPYRSDSVIGTNGVVRGYLNVTFHRGIYEWTTEEIVIQQAKEAGRQYAIFLEAEPRIWDMNAVVDAKVVQVETMEELVVTP